MVKINLFDSSKAAFKSTKAAADGFDEGEGAIENGNGMGSQ